MPKALVIEDERSIADAILYALETEGFSCRWAQSLGEARLLLHADLDLIVLDVGLPDGNGFEFCGEIRASEAAPAALLFLTARASEVDRVVGLEIGGDDYLVKPFGPRELGARAKALLRRTRRSTGAGAAVPSAPLTTAFVLDPGAHAIAYRGVPLELTRYEYRLLKALLERPDRVLSREQLMRLAWDEPEASLERTVDAHVKSLRAKLRRIDPEGDPIETRRGIGYVLRGSER
jgi:two-component system catabolic regulation response regulator CreB